MPPAEKKRRLAEDEDVEDDSDAASDGAPSASAASDDEPSDADASPDTDDEIAAAHRAKSTKTAKRKRRATDGATFGAALQTLLSTDTPSARPLSLKPAVARRRNEERLEKRARKVLKDERREREDSRRVKDVIGGWGAEGERALRKVAQRGVVKLFNAIQQSQQAAAQATEDAKSSRGTGKPTLPAPTVDSKPKGKKAKHKDNIIGRAKETNLDKDGFLDMIRSGGVVSKA